MILKETNGLPYLKKLTHQRKEVQMTISWIKALQSVELSVLREVALQKGILLLRRDHLIDEVKVLSILLLLRCQEQRRIYKLPLKVKEEAKTMDHLQNVNLPHLHQFQC